MLSAETHLYSNVSQRGSGKEGQHCQSVEYYSDYPSGSPACTAGVYVSRTTKSSNYQMNNIYPGLSALSSMDYGLVNIPLSLTSSDILIDAPMRVLVENNLDFRQ
ncbi:hypothetical protein NPIL_168571 [Nephila pilipes]|uniref:Uncharacterized protein n=1 Tax=Nephila pilipes TaxID=299642 RepID=A0A8X6NCP8_NEPPI|nr:hypothetical protein NPIL_168571 [Nephila pilipes]